MVMQDTFKINYFYIIKYQNWFLIGEFFYVLPYIKRLKNKKNKVKKSKKIVDLYENIVYNNFRWRAKKCEVAETPINVVMTVSQGIRIEQSII